MLNWWIITSYLFHCTVCCSPFDMGTSPISGVPQELVMSSPYLSAMESIHKARGKETLLGSNVSPASGIALGVSSLPPIFDASELSCFQFDSTCRWRNVEGLFIDELDWFQGSGTLDERRLQIAAGTHIIPEKELADGLYAIVATDTVQLPTAKAILAADQISCQIGPGQLRFKYWSSPEVRLRVCVKKISKAFSEYDFCSTDIEFGDPGPAYIFIVAEHFVFHAPDLQGGFAIIDDIEYKAVLCGKKERIDDNSQKSSIILMKNSSLRERSLTNGAFPFNPIDLHNACDVLTCQYEKSQPCIE
ncbi:hypothetical protein DICVIV_13333 [Dictyocaulus viviparus]|uniref:MAM domain-containing protein n=1 Tax=Dictyocaulus viviparus TaxID=29172 RepID=A0A0D8XAE1_DICVI|nr:hypothetical protein DICVIV_13333 [Dictyocaulus viviparus]